MTFFFHVYALLINSITKSYKKPSNISNWCAMQTFYRYVFTTWHFNSSFSNNFSKLFADRDKKKLWCFFQLFTTLRCLPPHEVSHMEGTLNESHLDHLGVSTADSVKEDSVDDNSLYLLDFKLPYNSHLAFCLEWYLKWINIVAFLLTNLNPKIGIPNLIFRSIKD